MEPEETKTRGIQANLDHNKVFAVFMNFMGSLIFLTQEPWVYNFGRGRDFREFTTQ